MADFIRTWAWPFYGMFMLALTLTVLSPDLYVLATSRKSVDDEDAQ
jgi:hypothetical protein